MRGLGRIPERRSGRLASEPVSEPEVSVVLAIAGDAASMVSVFAALQQGCGDVSAELIVVTAGAARYEGLSLSPFTKTRVEYCSAGTLTPVLWGTGLRLARGQVVAFTTEQMRVDRGWARALRDAVLAGASGAGGPIALGAGTSLATTAAYFLRYSAFSSDAWPTEGPAHDVAGDNAAYDRQATMRHADLVKEGFWEMEFHRRFERDGLHLKMIPAARATLVGPLFLATMFGQRFSHGREFGSTRVLRHGASRAKIVLSAPLVPLVLLLRIGRRVLRMSNNRMRFLWSLPGLTILAVAWAAGEAAGALRRGPRSAD